ncbi:hypothetical protein [Nonomuraea cypriaca]|nr:hypothetical protein [Nonomuraea cypriaca]
MAKVITQRELRDDSAAVMDRVEAGEMFHITRDGVATAPAQAAPERR